MHPPTLERQRFWAYASAFGALWGTLEVTVGAFLHTLKVPFTGPLLASVGVFLLVAQRQVLPSRGLTLATGLVAAACKSLSPGGVVLGPMVGITVEALVLEVALLPAPRALPAALLGGSAASLWAVAQKVLTHYVTFGGEVLRLYVRALKAVASSLGLRPSAGWYGLAFVAALIGFAGMLGALAGWRVGRACRAKLEPEGAA